jgi:hypothetical protein
MKKKIAAHMDLWKYGKILTIQKSLIIKQLKFSKKRFFIWVYHFVLHHILNPNNKFGKYIFKVLINPTNFVVVWFAIHKW